MGRFYAIEPSARFPRFKDHSSPGAGLVSREERLARKAAEDIVAQPPQWLVQLRAGGEVPGCSFLDSDTILANAEKGIGPSFGDSMHTEAVVQYVRKHRPHMVQVAEGPDYVSRSPGWSAWYVDSRSPDRLLFAPAGDAPSFLWIPTEGTLDGIASALSGYYPDPWPTRADLPAVARGFMGYREHIGVQHPLYAGHLPATRENLANYFNAVMFVQPGWWGNSCLDDPYPRGADTSLPLGGMPRLGLDLQWIGETAKEQQPGVPSMTWRTAQSRSYLSIEGHRGELFVANVCYRPSNHPHVVEAMDAEFGCTFPLDLPVDVIGALLGFDFSTLDMWEGRLAEETNTPDIVGQLEIALALAFGDLDGVDRLRPHMAHDDPATRAYVLNLIGSYQYLWILEEFARTEPEPGLSEQLQKALNCHGTGYGHPDVFAFGYGEDDYDEEDEEEDDDEEDD